MKNKIVRLLKKLKEKQKVTDKIYNDLYPPGLSPRTLAIQSFYNSKQYC